jgi:hypothetical protein
LIHLGYTINDQTVGNILKSYGIPPAPERQKTTTWTEFISQLILFGERSLRHTLTEYVTHLHQERPHQGKGNLILMPAVHDRQQHARPIRCYERLGGILKYYDREAT